MPFAPTAIGVLVVSQAQGGSSNTAGVVREVACAILVASAFVAVVDLWDFARKTHRKKLLDARVETDPVVRALKEHLARCPFELRDAVNARPSLNHVIRLVQACGLLLAWTGILPGICYLFGVLLYLGSDLLTAGIPAEHLRDAVFLAGFVLQIVHHVIVYRLKLYETLYHLKLCDTPYGPIEGYLRRKIGAST